MARKPSEVSKMTETHRADMFQTCTVDDGMDTKKEEIVVKVMRKEEKPSDKEQYLQLSQSLFLIEDKPKRS